MSISLFCLYDFCFILVLFSRLKPFHTKMDPLKLLASVVLLISLLSSCKYFRQEIANWCIWSPSQNKSIECVVVHFLVTGSALECYVCSNQTENTEKCLNTIKTCEQGEDVCLTEIRWGSQPYFTQGALKQYYVSKRCSTKKLCSTIRRKYMPYCTHIWYEDWTCSECCQGDRCNYYVIVSKQNATEIDARVPNIMTNLFNLFNYRAGPNVYRIICGTFRLLSH